MAEQQQIPEQADVVVIGGGPAGSMASGLLSQQGYEVVLLEKAKHPRMTVGESILPHFWRFTDRLGDASARIEEANFITKAGGIVRWDGTYRRTRFKDFGHSRKPLHADRDILDKILLDSSAGCGTRVFEQVAASKVGFDESGGVDVSWKSAVDDQRGRIRAKYLVDASGQSAVVARQLGFREFDEELRFSAVWGYYRGGQYLSYDGELHDFDSRFENPPVTFVESLGDWGWAWQIVLRETVSVGLVIRPEHWKQIDAASIDEKFTKFVSSTPGMRALLGDAEFIPGSVRVIRNYAYKPTKLAVDRCFLVGDAAAFVDPINSAGVTFGMYAATLAAWVIDRSLRNASGRESWRNYFEQEYRSRLHVFRTIALPPTSANDVELAKLCESFSRFSEAERQLALTTTVMTQRPGRVQEVLRALGMSEAAIYDEISVPLVID